MKVGDVPQDSKYLNGNSEINYAVDDNGRYQQIASTGWSVKNDALDFVMDDINEECAEILERVKLGKTSLLEYYAAKNVMSLELLSRYTGISLRKIRQHLDPHKFAELDESVLLKYADALRISVDELTTFPQTDQ